MKRRRIAVAGAGAWGMALAHVAQQAGHEVAMWSRRAPSEQAILTSDAVILAVPAQDCREALGQFAASLHLRHPVIIAAKGIERASGLFLNSVVSEAAPAAVAMVLSGPGFAAEVVAGKPTAVTLAAPSMAMSAEWAEALSLSHFRVYGSDDVLGVEIGGALKNVLAIACGISDGRGLGDSARAALTTRAFAELARFGRTLGARPETLTGLSGLGDLLLTCSSLQSRNYCFGRAVGEGMSVADALIRAQGVVEGVATAAVAAELARKNDIDMPIVRAVHVIVEGTARPEDEIARLLARPVGAEIR